MGQAAQEKGYEELNTPEVQNELINYLGKNGYNIQQITPEMLRSVYLTAQKGAIDKLLATVSGNVNTNENSLQYTTQENGMAHVNAATQQNLNRQVQMAELFQEDF